MSLTMRAGVTTAAVEGDELVLLDRRSGRYWQLNPTGSAVLRALLDGSALDDVAADLAREQGVPADRATADVTLLVQRLRDAELVSP